MKEKYFLYLSEPISSTIIESQVINWLEYLQNEGIVFDLFLKHSLTFLLKKDKEYPERVKKAKNKLKGKIYLIPAIRKKNIFLTSFLVEFLCLFFIILNKTLKNHKIIIQTRNFSYLNILKSIKFLFPKIKLVFDYRGAVAEEFLNKLGHKSIAEVNSKKIKRKYHKILSMQRKMFMLSDSIICVSTKLKDYVKKYYTETTISVIPGAADSMRFNYNPKVRNYIRHLLGLNNRVIFLYSGRLDSIWQMKEFIFEVMGAITQKYSQVYFICLTPDVKTGNKLIKKYDINMGDILLKYVRYEELWKYYNAADYGLLFREDIATNNVASPTKFCEYILCGLPVLISKQVGDFSDFVEKNNFGYVIQNTIEDILLCMDKIIEDKSINRKKISKVSSEYYSKQANLSKYLKVYS